MKKFVVKVWSFVYILLFEEIIKSPIENRRLLSRSVSAGLFWCFTPTVFFQQAVIFSYWYATRKTMYHVNFPVAWAWTWFSNPLTMGPLYYFYYLIGRDLIGSSGVYGKEFFVFSDVSFYGVFNMLEPILIHIIVGSLICSLIFGVVGYFGTYMLIGKLNR